MYKGEEGWVCHRHRPLRFFWVFSQRPKHQHLMFSVAVRSSIHHSFARILSRVQWWSVSMVTRYNVISRRWSSLFWAKVHVFFKFFFFSTIKVNLVAKIMQSAYFVLFSFLSTKKSPYSSESKIKSLKLNELMPLTTFQVSSFRTPHSTPRTTPDQSAKLLHLQDSWERPVDGRPRGSSEPPWSKHYFLRLLKA